MLVRIREYRNPTREWIIKRIILCKLTFEIEYSGDKMSRVVAEIIIY